MKKPILVVAATLKELKCFRDHSISELWGFPVVLEVCGVGLPHFTYKLTQHILKYQPQAIMLIGVAGVYPPFKDQFPVGSIVQIQNESAADLGKEANDFMLSLEDMGFATQKYKLNWNFNLYPFSSVFTQNKVDSTSVNLCTGSESLAEKRSILYNAQVENMEGYALALICADLQIPCIQIRAISNIATSPAKAEWNLVLALKNLNAAFYEFKNQD